MKIICCYATLHPKTALSIASFAPTAELVDTISDQYAYARALGERWGQDDLVVIEQDIEIYEDTISTFGACFDGWCCFGYELSCKGIGSYCTGALGCTKFSRELQRAVPFTDMVPAEQPWISLDAKIRQGLLARGYNWAVHGYVGHHHDYHKKQYYGPPPRYA